MAEDVFYTFWFEKNLQGDIVAVYNSAGTKLVSYAYDAWGNCDAIAVIIIPSPSGGMGTAAGFPKTRSRVFGVRA